MLPMWTHLNNHSRQEEGIIASRNLSLELPYTEADKKNNHVSYLNYNRGWS
ncbi:MAG: hypothetical protein RLZZ262_640 [Bacteroidota bacterium]|jgi:hypothetical protein